MEKSKIDEIIEVLKEKSFRTRTGEGPVVCYPDELLWELFGSEIAKKVFFECKSNINGKNPELYDVLSQQDEVKA